MEAQEKGADSICLWGDGSATREFLYVEDAAEAVERATECYDLADPINLGSGEEISILNLAIKIAELTGFRGDLKWDTTKPNGQPRRCLDVTRAERELGFRARTSLDQGIRATIDWYRCMRTKADNVTP
jgi:GDP-L-fucose synthase